MLLLLHSETNKYKTFYGKLCLIDLKATISMTPVYL